MEPSGELREDACPQMSRRKKEFKEFEELQEVRSG
jgi:hypothetical protein